jgi:IS30 family transposase
MSNSEACRVVGINRRTGTRWRFGRTILNTGGEPVHYPPVRILKSATPRHPRYLSLEERTTIADLHREQKTLREIAVAVGRHPSTISRELGRNSDAAGGYLPGTADRLMAERVHRPRRRRVAVDDELRAVVLTLLGQRWSPEQVGHDLRERFPGQRERHLCTESTLLCLSIGRLGCRLGGHGLGERAIQLSGDVPL